MPIPRIYQATALATNTSIQLTESAHHHLVRVLRAKQDDAVILFNGSGGEYAGTITEMTKKHVIVKLTDYEKKEAESPCPLYLMQGISRGEKMDYTIQKAVELGVQKIIPLITSRCNVKLTDARSEKRLHHWQAIAIGACEQSGRNRIPDILPPQLFEQGIISLPFATGLVFTPLASQKLKGLFQQQKLMGPIALLIGPEGGLTEEEIAEAKQSKFLPVHFGPRILRTETAAIAALSVLQCLVGDLG